MRDIKQIIIHCADTPDDRNFTAEDIRDWHINERGFIDIGYHYVILLDGTVELGRALDIAGAHCKGQNHDSIGICYIGGQCNHCGSSGDTRTTEQKEALKTLVNALKIVFPSIKKVRGHNDYTSEKTCPNFDVKKEFNDEKTN